jgi:mono/diheme cytochrome c family protein
MKTLKRVTAAILVLILLGAFLAWRVIRRGFSARETPSKMEVFVATKARALAIPASYRNLINPIPNSPENIRARMEHFADHCFLCHANNGSGGRREPGGGSLH